jgi:2-methylcitrate dehydratase PrpD
VDDWALKSYPSCFATHKAVDASLILRAHVGDATKITVSVQPRGTDPLLDDPPQTPQEAKFSMPFVVATALTHGAVRLSDFTR